MSDSVRKAAPVSASEWDYCTIKELSAALESRQISASELLERTVARRLNAVREAARAADIALAKGERRALLRIPLGQGRVQCCRLADDLGLPGVQGFCTERGCTHHLPYETCGGRPARQDQRAVGPRRFSELQRHLRNDQQSVGYQSLPGGSSGGSAAALAAGFGSLSFGSDISGSLRVPATHADHALSI